jgi:hypothetical protein
MNGDSYLLKQSAGRRRTGTGTAEQNQATDIVAPPPHWPAFTPLQWPRIRLALTFTHRQSELSENIGHPPHLSG